MGIDPNILTPEGWHAALASLEWQMDLGVTEITCEDPVDRYTLPDTVKPAASPAKAVPVAAPALGLGAVEMARTAAGAAESLDDLRAALTAFDGCELKRGAKNTVFADGNPAARVLILGDTSGQIEAHELPGQDSPVDATGRMILGGAMATLPLREAREVF